EGRGDEGPKPRPGRQTGLNSRGSLSYHPEMSRRDPGTVRRLHGFFREYNEGLEPRDFKRLFDRDAARAYAVLTREHSQVPEPKKGMRRFLFRAKLAFLGLSYKLSPPRRLLFAASLLAFCFGLFSDSGILYASRRLNVH